MRKVQLCHCVSTSIRAPGICQRSEQENEYTVHVHVIIIHVQVYMYMYIDLDIHAHVHCTCNYAFFMIYITHTFMMYMYCTLFPMLTCFPCTCTCRFRNELGRYNYVTPTSYLELISSFKSLLGKKRGEIMKMKRRYEVGLEKLAFAASQVNNTTHVKLKRKHLNRES